MRTTTTPQMMTWQWGWATERMGASWETDEAMGWQETEVTEKMAANWEADK
jgi:hypothetical protein